MVPRWGGLLIHNPPFNNDNYTLSSSEMHSIMGIFMSQLRDLMGIERVIVENTDDFKVIDSNNNG